MPSNYTDEEAIPSYSTTSTSRGGDNSYTERFRVDAPYRQPALHGAGQNSVNRMLSLIDRAVRPTLREPDLSLNLQIADIINEKKGNAPREAAVAIVNQINNRNSHVAILAISVLDVCVKNCGYPFHLQISRKDFLNNLVKRFPERPPLHYSRIQLLILECIEEWRETIVRTSKYRDDLGYIRDMHRLLSHKGYMFPEINRDDAAVLNAPETLKSAAELEQEDREAQSVKLQELIRSGTPQDLKEANHLMSVMAGFRETKVDYHAKVAKELDKLRRKGEILEEMLNNLQPGEPIADDDVFTELVISLRNAMPRIEKIIADEQGEDEDDEESRAKVIALGDYINSLVAKYDLVSKGDYEGAQNVQLTSLASGRKIDTSRQAVIDSLIDIDEIPASATSSGEGASAADLLGLNFGGLTLGGGSPSPMSGTTSNSNILDLFDTPSPVQSAAPPEPVSKSPVTANPTTKPTSTIAGNDLFDDWGLSSAPTPAPAASSRTLSVVNNDKLKIEFLVTKTATSTDVSAKISNPTDKKITNFKLELASTKTRPLRLDAATGTTLEAQQQDGISQTFSVNGSEPLKLRWRVAFKLGLSDTNLDGVIADL